MKAENKYSGLKIFDALKDIEQVKQDLRNTYPEFSFTAEKGDIAEAYCIEAYGLRQAPKGQSGYDAVGPNGEKVSIKMLWEINIYRGLAFSGGSNQTPYAYREADYLLVIGRDETNAQMSVIYNGPLDLLEPEIKGTSIHPRIEVRTLKKMYQLVPQDKRLKASKDKLPDANPIYYPKDLHLFGIPRQSNYWNKFTMLWRNYENRHLIGVTLQNFLEFKAGNIEGESVLSLKDCKFLSICYKYHTKKYDHFLCAFAAYAEINDLDFPILEKVSEQAYRKYGFSGSALKTYRNHSFIGKHFSYFFTHEHRGEGGRVTRRYMTPHDIKLLKRAYEIRGREKQYGRGVKDQVDYIVAGIQAAKEVGMAPDFQMPDPREEVAA